MEKKYESVTKFFVVAMLTAILVAVTNVTTILETEKLYEGIKAQDRTVYIYMQVPEEPTISVEENIKEPDPELSEQIEIINLTQQQIINRYIFEICQQYDFDPYIVMAVVEHESRYTPDATNGNHIGLMQVNQNIHAARCEQLGVTNLYDPYQNILAGVDLLSELNNDYGSSGIGYVLMCYNQGPASAANSSGLSNYATSIMGRAEEFRQQDEGELYGQENYTTGK